MTLIALPTFAALAAFSAAAMLLILTPGPDMTLFLGRTLSHGRARGLMSLLGVSAGLLVHTVLAAVGLSALLAASSTAFTVVKFAGAAYLIVLAVRSLRSGSSLTLGAAGVAPTLARTFWSALAINLLNPKIVLFFLTFLPQFVDTADPAAHGQIVFFGLSYVGLSLVIGIGLILAADRIAGGIRRSPGALRWLDRVVAVLFAGFALRLVLAQRG